MPEQIGHDIPDKTPVLSLDGTTRCAKCSKLALHQKVRCRGTVCQSCYSCGWHTRLGLANAKVLLQLCSPEGENQP